MSDLEAFVFGATLALAVGPISLLIVNIAARQGLVSGLKAGLGAALADLTFALLAFFAGSELANHLHAHERSLKGFAAVVLLALGLRMIQQAMKPARTDSAHVRDEWRAPILQIYVLTLINPLGVLAFVAFALQLPKGSGSLMGIIGPTISLFAGSMLVQSCLALISHGLGRMLPAGRWTKIANLASGFGITLFGLIGVYRWLST